MRRRDARASLAVAAAAVAVTAGAVAAGAGGDGGDAPAIDAVRAAAEARGGPEGAYARVTTAARFAPGVTYGEALRALFVAEHAGWSPLPFAVVDAPAGGAVLVRPRDAREGVTVWLGAPYGHTEASGASAPALTPTGGGEPPAGGAMSDAGPWPAEVSLGVPILPACQVAVDAPAGPVGGPCGDDDLPLLDAEASPPLPLP